MKVEETALSFVETEYMAMCQAVSVAVWLTRPLEDLGIDLQSPSVVLSYSQGW